MNQALVKQREMKLHLTLPLSLCPQNLLMAMKDMNTANMTSTDLPLFNWITQDLLPAVETPITDKVNSSRSAVEISIPGEN